MEEVWKVIKEAPNYSVSNLGRVKNNKTNYILKTQKSEAYERIGLICLDGKKHNKRVHRLVLETFNPIEGMKKLVVNHKDANHFNNNLNNLEWLTQSENTKRTWERGRVHCNNTEPLYYINSIESEYWIPIKGYELYEISNLGRIRVVKTQQILRPRDINKYLYARLMDANKTQRTLSIHRLMMKNFYPIDNAEEMQVNHIDGNKYNNQLDNLEWCTGSENIQHMLKLKEQNK
jgi:D-hexose-6-phosphate mutarotase